MKEVLFSFPLLTLYSTQFELLIILGQVNILNRTSLEEDNHETSKETCLQNTKQHSGVHLSMIGLRPGSKQVLGVNVCHSSQHVVYEDSTVQEGHYM